MNPNPASFSYLKGSLPNDLANAVSDAVHTAVSRGMGLDEAVCVVVAVAADYARGEYGDRYLKDLAAVVRERAGRPLPENIGAA